MIFTTVLLLALGGGVTVVSAWVCALIVDVSGAEAERSVFETDDGWWIVDHVEAFGSIRVLRCVPVAGIEPEQVEADHRSPHWWMNLHGRRAQDPGAAWRWMEDLRGWPFPALRSHIEFRGGDDWETLATAPGFAMDGSFDDLPARKTTLRVLPATPVWRGFILNTLYYAAITGGLFVVSRWAWRRVRRERGRCPACGYDLRGDLDGGCPECGWGRGTLTAGEADGS